MTHLDRLRGRLVGVDALPEGWSAELRAALESLQADPARPAVEAVGRLVLMSEVGDCLGHEGSGAASGLPLFFAEALGRLADGLGNGDLDGATTWILRESSAGWGEYLTLIDPSLDAGPMPDPWDPAPDEPTSDDAGPAIALASLLRTLTGTGPARAPEHVEESRPSMRPGADEAIEATDPGGRETIDPPANRADVDLEEEARSLGLDPEIRRAFAADLADLFGRIQDLVLGLGGDDDARRLGELGRCYHTLKGSAGSVGLLGLAAEIHALEDRLGLAGGRASADLIGRLEASLGRIEGVLGVLEGPPEARDPAGASRAPRAEEPDGLIRFPADRFEELTDLASDLLTRRRAWAEQAERMTQLADTARACGHRLRTSVDRLAEAIPGDARPRDPRAEDLPGLALRLAEQAEDLVALAATAREAAIPASEEAEALSRLSLRLWETLQSVRIVPVRGLLQRLVRVARDTARIQGRAIEVELIGEDTGADRILLDKAYEPLLHVVPNAVDHGVEPPEDRSRSGKPATGRITLEARREGNTLAIAMQDDGRGLDVDAIAAKGRRLGLLSPDERPGIEQIHALIFRPGFSTRGQADTISGRGVGMDVVAREVELLRGRVALSSEAGRGTRLAIRLPTRLALEHVMIVRVGGRAFAVPTSAIASVHRDEGGEDDEDDRDEGRRATTIGGRRLPVADLGSVLGIPDLAQVPCPTLLVVGDGGASVALRVDRIDGALELVIRPLGPLLDGHPAISGAGLTTGGEIVPALDVSGLLRLSRGGSTRPGPPEAGDRPRALVVDDSLSVRRIATRNLRALGLEVDEASDGEQALGRLRQRPYRLILTDLEMPRMDGFALLAELGRTGALAKTPVVVSSTRSDPETRRRVLDLGARAYVLKPVIAEELADVVGSILAGDGGRWAVPLLPGTTGAGETH